MRRNEETLYIIRDVVDERKTIRQRKKVKIINVFLPFFFCQNEKDEGKKLNALIFYSVWYIRNSNNDSGFLNFWQKKTEQKYKNTYDVFLK